MTSSNLEDLQAEWTTLYRTTLPILAREKHTSKTTTSTTERWPVVLDHCFARIILDNAVGKSKPWTAIIKAPATKNMSAEQLRSAIELGRRIECGEEDLWALDGKSLLFRGKKTKGVASAGEKKRKREEEDAVVINAGVEAHPTTQESSNPSQQAEHEPKQEPTPASSPSVAVAAEEPKQEQQRSRKAEMTDIWSTFSPSTIKASNAQEEESLERARQLIASDSSLKPFRKHVLTLLTQVPRGRYTTYQALSDAAVRFDRRTDVEVDKGPKKDKARGNARAIGGAMRNNPFAPTVPCHRVLASNGMLGGFGGQWGEDGKFADEKKRLLREEGLRFDGKGKVVGEPFKGFWAYASVWL